MFLVPYRYCKWPPRVKPFPTIDPPLGNPVWLFSGRCSQFMRAPGSTSTCYSRPLYALPAAMNDAHPIGVPGPHHTTTRARPGDHRMISCSACTAACCRLEVVLMSDTGVPARFIATDRRGNQSMRRLDDGWCAALDRGSMRCTIYDRRPFICRDFEEGGTDCVDARREASALWAKGNAK